MLRCTPVSAVRSVKTLLPLLVLLSVCCLPLLAAPPPAATDDLPEAMPADVHAGAEASENRILLFCPTDALYPGAFLVPGRVSNTGTAFGGPFPVTGVQLDVMLPAGVELEESSASRGTWTVDGMTARLDVGEMDANEEVDFDFTIRPPGPGSFTFDFTLTQDDFNPGPGTGSCTVNVEEAPAQADLGVTKSGPDRVGTGEDFAYTIEVTNHGPDDAAGLLVRDVLPTREVIGVQVAIGIIDVLADGECETGETEITCTFETLAAGETRTITILAWPLVLGNLVNTVEVSATEPEDPDPSNNQASVTTRSIRGSSGSASNHPDSGDGGDPVNTFTGELFFSERPDLALTGPFPLVFQRHYASLLGPDGRLRSALGRNWSHNYEWSLQRIEADSLDVVAEHGAAILFVRSGSEWSQATQTGRPLQLVEQGGTFHLGDPRTGRSYAFDEAGRLVGVADGRGSTHVLTYDDGRVASVADDHGRVITFEYVGDRLTAITDGTRTVAFGHDGPNLTSVTDVLGGVTEYRYEDDHDVAGLLAATERPNGNVPLQQTYDGEGRVATQTDATGAMRSFTYDDDVTVITDPDGAQRTHTYDADGRLLVHTDAQGRTHSAAYSENGRRDLVTGPGGETFAIAYHAGRGDVTSVTLPDGSSVAVDYAPRSSGVFTYYDVERITYPDGTSDAFQYDGSGNLTTWSDRAGRQWTFSYDDRGGVISATDPSGSTETRTYDGGGMLASRQDAIGRTTTFTYDAFGNLTERRGPDGSAIVRTYDAAGRIVTQTDESGETRTFSYDANGNVLAVDGPLGTIVSYEYDGLDRPIRITDPMGGSVSVTYDVLGRVATVRDQNGNATEFAYDSAGRLISRTDAEGSQWHGAYDAAGRLTALTDPIGGTLQFSYDARGQVTSAVGPLGNPTAYAYDALGNLTAVESPTGHVQQFTRDARGLLTRIALPEGISVDLTLDAVGRITELVDPNGNAWNRTYDAEGRLTSVRDPAGRETTFQYDPRGRVQRVGYPNGGSVEMTYDARDEVLREDYSDGTVRSFLYDAAGRIVQGEGVALDYDARSAITASNGIAIARDAAGRITSVDLGGGRLLRYFYDRRDLPARVEDWLGGATTLAYDAAGRLTSISRPNGVATGLGYDAEWHLTLIEETRGDVTVASIELTRNALGNPTSARRRLPVPAVAASGSATLSVDVAHQVEGFTYDALGRRTADGKATYAWDLASRMTSYASNGSSVEFTYDAFDNLISRSSGPSTRHFVWNYALALPSPVVLRENGQDVRYLVHTPDGLLLYTIEAADEARRFFHFDERGNTIFLTDDDGGITAAYAYEPYGRVLSATGDLDNPFTFGGRFGVMQEGDAGLYLMRRRFYDAATGRFLSPDPIRTQIDPQLINPYQYGAQNPMRFVDPRGEDPVAAGGSGTAAETVGNLATAVSGGSYVVEGVANGFQIAPTSPVAPTSTQPGGLTNAFLNSARKEANNAMRFADAGNQTGSTAAANQASQHADRAMRTHQTGRAASAAGNVATVVGVGVELRQAQQNMDRVSTEFERQQEAALRTFDLNVRRAIEAFESKRITRQEFERRIREAQELLKDSLENVNDLFKIDLAIEGTKGLINSLGAMLPFPNPFAQ